jgi:hypothetical protein
LLSSFEAGGEIGRLREGGAELVEGARDRSFPELLLAPEMVGEEAEVHAGPRRDVARARAVEAALGEDLQGGGEDALAGGLGGGGRHTASGGCGRHAGSLAPH